MAEALAPVARADEISFDESERLLLSADLFHQGAAPAAIARPRDRAALARIIGAATGAGVPIVPRGGGISYSAGYVCDREDALVIDMRQMNAILRTDPEAGLVTVESGCTWAELYTHLHALGLRTPYWGPASGKDATIGGTLSQQGVLFGSGQFGPAGDNVEAMTIVLADGTLLDTQHNAEWSVQDFVGDCGALGIKAEITLPLIAFPKGRAYAAFLFADDNAARQALAQTARLGLASEGFLFDRCWSDRRQGTNPEAGSLTGFPGHRHSTTSRLELHVAFEDADEGAACGRRAAFTEVCGELGGEPAGDGVLGLFHAHPFVPPSLMIGPEGRRWIPVHFIVPHQACAAMFAALHSCIEGHGALVAEHGITWGWSAMILGRDHVLIEPSLYWADVRPPQVDAYLDAGFLADQPTFPANPAAFAAVNTLRAALIEAGRPVGARHLQVGRLYPPGAAFTRWSLDDLRERKRRLDPRGLMNPGVFGL